MRFHRKVKASGAGAGGGAAAAIALAQALGVHSGPALWAVQIAVAILGALAAGWQVRAAPADVPPPPRG